MQRKVKFHKDRQMTVEKIHHGKQLLSERGYDAEGQLCYERLFNYILSDGNEERVTFYHENGARKFEVNFKNNKHNGLFTIWYENGRLLMRKSIINDTVHGTCSEWNKKGKLMFEYTYNNGALADTKFYAINKFVDRELFESRDDLLDPEERMLMFD